MSNVITTKFNGFEYDKANGSLLVNFEAEKDNLFSSSPLELVYKRIKPEIVTREEAVDIFCSVAIPHLAANFDEIRVIAPGTKGQAVFWPRYIDQLFSTFGKTPVVNFEKLSNQEEVKTICQNSTSQKTALLFGGGVESLAALNLLINQKPVLLSLMGPRWMNNDHELSPLKRKLEDKLVARFSLKIARVWSNIKEIFAEGDEYINKFVTGSFMYYSFAPLIRELMLQAIFHAMEFEYSCVKESYDRSIHPRFSYTIPRKELPPIISVLNSFPKIEIFEILYRTNPELCSFVYSCLKNTNTRWCGECGKCRRISAFCEAIGIPKSHIGMQGDIPYEPENGKLSQLYWKNLKIYKSKKHKNSKKLEHKTVRIYQKLKSIFVNENSICL